MLSSRAAALPRGQGARAIACQLGPVSNPKSLPSRATPAQKQGWACIEGDRANQSKRNGIENRLKRALEKMEASQRHLPSSTPGEAISYTLSHWDFLTKYVANGRIGIDNNGVKNAIQPTAIGKKNWLFFGEAETGQRSSVIYTIIESWRRHGIEPREYMRDVLTRITEASSWQVADLTPEKWVDKKLSLKKAA